VSILALGNAGGRIFWGWANDAKPGWTLVLSQGLNLLAILGLLLGGSGFWLFALLIFLVGFFFGGNLVLYAAHVDRVFGPGSLAEVPLACPLPGVLPAPHDRLSGTIDRLVVTPNRVLAVDFKSNATIPDTPDAVPEGILRQMGAYAAALEAIYPDHAVDVALLWTRGPRMMPLPRDLVMAALRRARGSPDRGRGLLDAT